MELYWNIWHKSQLPGWKLQSYEDKWNSTNSIRNLRASDVYFELNDNLLIIGAGILCKNYVYTKMLEFYGPDKMMMNKVDFYTKAWELYQEALQKYYPFFHHYNWHVKLALLEGSKTDIIDEMNRAISFEFKVKSLPPLNEKLLSQSIKPRWYDKVRYTDCSDFKESLGVHSTKMQFIFDSKKIFCNEKLLVKSCMPKHK
jgi:hypothetical protein